MIRGWRMGSYAASFLILLIGATKAATLSGQIDGRSDSAASNATDSPRSRSLARQCKPIEAMVRIELDTDRYGWETSWRIVRGNQEVISGPPPNQNYARNQVGPCPTSHLLPRRGDRTSGLRTPEQFTNFRMSKPATSSGTSGPCVSNMEATSSLFEINSATVCAAIGDSENF